MAQADVSFLPFVREGLASSIAAVDTLQPQRALAHLDVVLSINGSAEPAANFRLRGPGDVVGINSSQIVRMEPVPGTIDFEPNYFPCIEFDRPDFPWIFTPAKADNQGRLRPWMCLVVVRQTEGVMLTRVADGPLPVLEVGAALADEELPDPGQSWAWAHVQVAAGAAGDIGGALAGSPERSISRLMCPRLLAPLTDYLACVVPAFEPGRKAGLGIAISEEELQSSEGLKPAWIRGGGAVRLPVYHHWAFRTGLAGDFETLARGLAARPAPAGLGERPADIAHPGFRWAGGDSGEPFPVMLEGALRPIRPSGTIPASTVPAEFGEKLEDIINAPTTAAAADPDSDPLLAPPLYGRWHTPRPAVSAAETGWYRELNLDPMRRAVAAFGTRVIQQNQEALMAAAWKQAADLPKANQRMRQLQFGIAIGTRLHKRHFETQPDAAIFRLSTPAFARMRFELQGAAASETLFARVESSSFPVSSTSPAMRRIGRARGPLTRRFAARGFARLPENWLNALDEVLTSAPEVFIAPMATVGAVLFSLPQGTAIDRYPEVRDDTLAIVPGRPQFQTVAEGHPVPVVPVQPGEPQSADSPSAAAFRAAAIEHLTVLVPGRMTIMVGPPAPVDVPQLRASILEQMRPRAGLILLARAIVTAGENASQPAGTSASEPTGVDNILAYPHFPAPMYGPLRDLSQDLLLPGLGDVPPETVLGLSANRQFVESYMVGLNVEMARELLWRGFPTDQLGTYFDQFWDTSTSPDPRPDIAPLTQWSSRPLGENSPAPVQNQFVMLIRSTLLRRYPNAIIFAAPAVDSGGSRKPDLDPARAAYPAFKGSLDPDVSFFGFDLAPEKISGSDGGKGYFLIIQEHPSEPRFGLDEDLPTIGTSHLLIGSGPPAGHDAGSHQWGRNAAQMAGAVRQLPVMVAVHASRFVTGQP